MRSLVSMLSMLLLSSCMADAQADRPPPESVHFNVTGCFGTCPVFSVSLRRDGKGSYDGAAFVAVKGRREFTASPAEVRAFLSRIGSFRPNGVVSYDDDDCEGPVATDHPTVNVMWKSAGGEDVISWYLGCKDPKLSAISPDLYGAWQELPIRHFVEPAEK